MHRFYKWLFNSKQGLFLSKHCPSDDSTVILVLLRYAWMAEFKHRLLSRLTCSQDEDSCSQENTFHFYCFICSHLITVILDLLLAKWEFSWVTCPESKFKNKIDIKSNDKLWNHKPIFTLGENACFFIHVQHVLNKTPQLSILLSFIYYLLPVFIYSFWHYDLDKISVGRQVT